MMCRGCQKIAHIAKITEVARVHKADVKKPLKTEASYVKKEVREVDEAYLRFIRSLPCLVQDNECVGSIHAHHTISRGAGGSDYTCIPLCFFHHHEVHTCGKQTFANIHKFDYEKQINRLKLLYKLKFAKENDKEQSEGE